MGGLHRIDKACNIRPTAKSTDFTKKKRTLEGVQEEPERALCLYRQRGGRRRGRGDDLASGLRESLQ